MKLPFTSTSSKDYFARGHRLKDVEILKDNKTLPKIVTFVPTMPGFSFCFDYTVDKNIQKAVDRAIIKRWPEIYAEALKELESKL